MAAQTSRLFQDQNRSANNAGEETFSGKADFAGQRKAGAGARKPLGDLSNAGKPVNQVHGKKVLDGSIDRGKPSISQSSKPLKSKILENNKRTARKASEKSLTGCRKALSDISNSGKPHVPEIKNKISLKSSSLTEESLHPNAIAEERILHNHQECIKSQFETAQVHQFFKTVGLEDDSDDHMTISFELPALCKLKSENECFELEEVPERLPVVQSLSAQTGSPAHCKTPSIPSSCSIWNDIAVNFKLIETPKLSKN
ncbi:uncharacterized protein LOC113871760 [Abrus precatorius]|uniref:Uncharacterized protein LOC113871760 n=1 Tax=Abrus precatorius TaxID=3816 RepID=A0A8B8M9J5_ABRPR|nr:uncharacterized protein LOC113871760 [Abrus precatorius]